MKELFTALSKFQGECPTIEKSRKVDSVSKRTGTRITFTYADMSDIMEKIRPLLEKHGLCVCQFAESDETGDWIRTILGHVSGQSLESKIMIRYPGDTLQTFGGSITYYKRYAICSMLGIVSDDDVDEVTEIKDPNNPYKQVQKNDLSATDAQLTAIKTLISKMGTSLSDEEVKARYGKMKKSEASEVIKELNKNIMEKQKESRNVA